MKELIKAVNKVMESCENVDKSMTIGQGRNSYNGVADKDVKLMLNKAMRENGLAMFPVKIEPTTTVERWTEETQYGKKQKQSAFTEVVVTYKLIHESGQEIELQGYGHGIDSQDKASGKATTYAMKYALLYTFMVATGAIDDTDKTHSDQIETPKAKPQPKKVVKFGTEAFTKVVDWIVEEKGTIAKAVQLYDIDEDELKKAVIVKKELT